MFFYDEAIRNKASLDPHVDQKTSYRVPIPKSPRHFLCILSAVQSSSLRTAVSAERNPVHLSEWTGRSAEKAGRIEFLQQDRPILLLKKLKPGILRDIKILT